MTRSPYNKASDAVRTLIQWIHTPEGEAALKQAMAEAQAEAERFREKMRVKPKNVLRFIVR